MKTDDRLHASMDVEHKKILSPRHNARTRRKDITVGSTQCPTSQRQGHRHL